MSEAMHHMNSEKVFKIQPTTAGGVMATPILKKSIIRRPGGSGHILEPRKLNASLKETCTTQNELKKKIGHIFKL